jgi:mono/diheme cytochrome c family protein
MLTLTLLALIPVALLVKARVTHSDLPRFMVIYDMDNQQKVKTQRASAVFTDGLSMRVAPEGTVDRDAVVGDPALTDGGVGPDFDAGFPVPVDRPLLERGRERFGIYCAPCHGLDGRGDGMVHRRADALMEGTWVAPTDLVSDAVIARTEGHLYNTIRQGIRKMPAYGAQIPLHDRWAIVAYVRALQKAQAGTLEDLNENDRAALTAAR